ncbi:MAG: hypothetical protein ACRDGQ_01790, partial [Candidatus Limnocylindrales bacterium]
MTTALDLRPGQALSAGDRRRRPIGRAVVGTLALAGVFVAFAFLAKEVPAAYDHAPWQDDPYDAVVSFAIFFVPLVAGLSLLRLPLCRVDEPLPVQRAVDLLRAARVILAVVMVTVAADWVSILTRANAANWTSVTALLIALLGLATIALAVVGRAVRRAGVEMLPLRATRSAGPDWLADLMVLARRSAGFAGPARPVALRMVGWLDRHVTQGVRERPLTTAAVVSIGFGLLIATRMSLAEGPSPTLWLFLGVATCGMFAFVSTAGWYLGLVHPNSPPGARRRRLVHATVGAAASVPIALGFRDSLPWMADAGATSGLDRLAPL